MPTRFLDDMKLLEGGWPERVLTMQRNWIGKSYGCAREIRKCLAVAGRDP